MKMKKHYEKPKILYVCNPDKNVKCKKTSCYINGGECSLTAKEEFAKTNESGNAIKERLGACKDCEYSMFRGVMLLCRKYNVPMLYEASCPDFYPKKTYAKQKEVEIND